MLPLNNFLYVAHSYKSSLEDFLKTKTPKESNQLKKYRSPIVSEEDRVHAWLLAFQALLPFPQDPQGFMLEVSHCFQHLMASWTDPKSNRQKYMGSCHLLLSTLSVLHFLFYKTDLKPQAAW